MNEVFTTEQIGLLNKTLDPRFISERVGGNNTKLKYIEGHDAIDQANRIFGYGNWSYRPVSCEQTVLMDPLTGEAVGVVYKAQVELIVNGCGPIVEVGSQPVVTWNVDDYVIKQRMNAVKYGKVKQLEEGPFTSFEKAKARTAIVDAHEMAEKGAVTDALKRALRTFGEQFGNGLYGDGRIIVAEEAQANVSSKTNSTSAQSESDVSSSAHAPGSYKEVYKEFTKNYQSKGWDGFKVSNLGSNIPDENLTPEQCQVLWRKLKSMLARPKTPVGAK